MSDHPALPETPTVAVLGLGYVGLPLLHAVAAAGLPAIGIDSDPDKIHALHEGRSYLPHLAPDLPAALNSNPSVTLSTDRGALAAADAILICVPTPLTDSREPDLSYVERAARDIGSHAVAIDPARPRLIVLESSTYPGTTREILKPAVLAAADELVKPATVTAAPLMFAYSPEREDPGNPSFTTRTIPKLVGGIDDASTNAAVGLYQRIVETVVPCRTADVAEAAKLVENIYRSVNIALVNELKLALDALGLDVREVLDAAATKPFGFQRFEPGPGFGGHCVPIDPYYLAHRAKQAGVDSRFIELAGEINRAMPAHVVGKVRTALESRGKDLAHAHVLVLGVAYKKNVADIRESPAFEIIEQLVEHGARVEYHDPHVERTHKGRRRDYELRSIQWSAEALSASDAVVIATDHDWYDWDFVAGHARLIVDTRGAMRGYEGVIPA